jgi:hypothetical protein
VAYLKKEKKEKEDKKAQENRVQEKEKSSLSSMSICYFYSQLALIGQRWIGGEWHQLAYVILIETGIND